jgi:hypothetical protein
VVCLAHRGRRFGRIRVESAARACRVDHSALSLYLVPQRPQARGYTLPTPNQPINRRGVVGESSAPPHTSSELRRRSGGGGDAGIRRTGGLTATCYCHTPPRGVSRVSTCRLGFPVCGASGHTEDMPLRTYWFSIHASTDSGHLICTCVCISTQPLGVCQECAGLSRPRGGGLLDSPAADFKKILYRV